MDAFTPLSLTSYLWDIGKQCGPRCDAAKRGIPMAFPLAKSHCMRYEMFWFFVHVVVVLKSSQLRPLLLVCVLFGPLAFHLIGLGHWPFHSTFTSSTTSTLTESAKIAQKLICICTLRWLLNLQVCTMIISLFSTKPAYTVRVQHVQ